MVKAVVHNGLAGQEKIVILIAGGKITADDERQTIANAKRGPYRVEVLPPFFGIVKIDIYRVSKLALKMILLTGQRPGEVCGMTWTEIDDNGFWEFPCEICERAWKHHEVLCKSVDYIRSKIAYKKRLEEQIKLVDDIIDADFFTKIVMPCRMGHPANSEDPPNFGYRIECTHEENPTRNVKNCTIEYCLLLKGDL